MSFKEQAFTAKARTVRRVDARLYRELLTNQALSADALADLSRSRTAALARFAFESSPFYGDLYRSQGFGTGDLGDPDTWRSLPTVHREDVKAQADRIWTSDRRRGTWRESRTGGTTGQPLVTGQDTRVGTTALGWRMFGWWGVSPWDDMARVGRWPTDRRSRLTSELGWWPTRHVLLDAGMLDGDVLGSFAEQCRRVRPVLLEGYLGGLKEIADYAAANPGALPSPSAVGSTAAPLPPPVRQRIQQALGAPVYDQYRSSEVSWIAGECREQSGLHVFSDHRLVEVVDEEGRPTPPGVVGDIVVTDLSNRVFPLLRYRNGDRGSLRGTACPCGLPFPLMDPPDGRSIDALRLPGGAVVAGGLTMLFATEPDCVRLFQIHQTADATVRLRVVLTEAPGAREAVDRVADILRERVDNQVPVVVEVVDSLPQVRGKLQYVISDVIA